MFFTFDSSRVSPPGRTGPRFDTRYLISISFSRSFRPRRFSPLLRGSLQSKAGAKILPFSFPPNFFSNFFPDFFTLRCQQARCGRKFFSKNALGAQKKPAKHLPEPPFPLKIGLSLSAKTALSLHFVACQLLGLFCKEKKLTYLIDRMNINRNTIIRGQNTPPEMSRRGAVEASL